MNKRQVLIAALLLAGAFYAPPALALDDSVEVFPIDGFKPANAGLAAVSSPVMLKPPGADFKMQAIETVQDVASVPAIPPQEDVAFLPEEEPPAPQVIKGSGLLPDPVGTAQLRGPDIFAENALKRKDRNFARDIPQKIVRVENDIVKPPRKPAREASSSGYGMNVTGMDAQEILAMIDPAAGEAIKPSRKPTNNATRISATPMKLPEENIFTLAFMPGEQNPDKYVIEGLREKILVRALLRPSDKIQIHAYADVDQDGKMEARRLSLERALAVRDFLVANQVAPGRISLRPMGENAKLNEPDKADIVFITASDPL